MRAVIQRVDGADVVVAGEVVGSIEGPGLLMLVGVTHTDDEAIGRRLAQKAYDLRIFDATRFEACHVPGGPKEVSASDLGLPVLELQTRVELVENQAAFLAMGFVEVGRTAHKGYDRPTSITYRRAVF